MNQKFMKNSQQQTGNQVQLIINRNIKVEQKTKAQALIFLFPVGVHHLSSPLPSVA